MPDHTTCTRTGASRKKYVYEIHVRHPKLPPNEPGTYIYATRKWVPIYIGEGNLTQRAAPDRCGIQCIDAKGATHVHLHVNYGRDDRLADRRDTPSVSSGITICTEKFAAARRKPRSQRSVIAAGTMGSGFCAGPGHGRWRASTTIEARRRSGLSRNRVNRAGAAPHGKPEPAWGQPAISRSKPMPAVAAAFRLARALSRRLDHPSSARRPASVIRIRATLIFLGPTLTVSRCPVASSLHTRSASAPTVNP